MKIPTPLKITTARRKKNEEKEPFKTNKMDEAEEELEGKRS